jgi:hypothetical protein
MQEPLNDDELNKLLKQWESPVSAPREMEQALLARINEPLWRRFWTMSFRIPAPVAAALIVSLAAWLLLATRNPQPKASTQDAGFEPVKEWKTTIVRSSYVSN